MWVEYKRVANQILAETWKDLLEAQDFPTRIVADPDHPEGGISTPKRIFIPESKTQVADEVLRKV
jgi:hypothetical protein